jgi:hypothetical protein
MTPYKQFLAWLNERNLLVLEIWRGKSGKFLALTDAGFYEYTP